MRHQLYIVLLLGCLLLTGCNDDASSTAPGAAFLGVWQGRDYTAEITRNGDSFLLTIHDSSGMDKHPATLENDVLFLRTGWGETAITHIKADDTLVFDNRTFTRIESRRK